MIKPFDYDSVKVDGFDSLPAGGYVLKVIKVKKSVSKSGNPMLEVFFDIAKGNYEGYFQDRFNNLEGDNKFYSGIYYVPIEKNGCTHWRYKQFLTYIEQENSYVIDWVLDYDQLESKIFGAIIRIEERDIDGITYYNPKIYKLEHINKLDSVKPPKNLVLNDDFEALPF